VLKPTSLPVQSTTISHFRPSGSSETSIVSIPLACVVPGSFEFRVSGRVLYNSGRAPVFFSFVAIVGEEQEHAP